MEESLYQKLESYSNTDYYPFHMPGHKRNMKDYTQKKAYEIDITEIDEFDNLHHAEGILLDAMKRASELYQSEETHFLVNGSTCGILSSISATVRKHGKILISRNCHKAAYHALYLRELQPVYLYPPIQKKYGITDAIDPRVVEDALERDPDIEAVFITSPTYDGIVSNISEIVRIAHEKGIPVIVDEAHGAHFGFYKDFPQNSIVLGADIVIHSVHKTLPAFTQTALLHMNGPLINRKKVNDFLGIYQTSSPSYVLMGGIDACIEIVKTQGTKRFKELSENISTLLDECKDMKHIQIFQESESGYQFDQSKILMSVKGSNLSGHELAQILRKKYHLQMEMEAPTYVIAITSIMDTKEGFYRLSKALREIDQEIDTQNQSVSGEYDESMDSIYEIRPEKKYELYQVEDMEKESICFTHSNGRISGEFIYLYPPGIPLVAPGEVITRDIIRIVETCQKQGFAVQGPEDYTLRKISVIK